MEKREIVNNIQERPFEHYCALYKALDPAEAARRCAVRWDAEAGEFELVFLGNLYRVAFPDFAVRCAERRVPADRLNGLGKGQILLLRHLLEGTAVPANGNYYTYQEMPWGQVYNRQFTGRVINRLAFSYGKRLGDFCAVLEALGAEKIKGGDAGYALDFLPGLTLRLMLWEADEEFPPSAQVLFSDNFPRAFAPEDLAVVGDVLLDAMKETDAALKSGKGA
jgi:hypothetical protein